MPISQNPISPLFGIIGGMGPLASAEFLHSIYFNELHRFSNDQDYPRIILLSDPSIPDRTQAYNKNQKLPVISFFEEAIHNLSNMGASEIIIVCVTAHFFLNDLSQHSQVKVTSLIDLLYHELDKLKQPSLLLSSKMTHELQMIDHPTLLYPEVKDAEIINKLIFQMKGKIDDKLMLDFIEVTELMAKKYNTQSLVFSCTELHLMNKIINNKFNRNLSYQVLDPLEIAVNYIINKHLTFTDKDKL